jgi:hypothetical protein
MDEMSLWHQLKQAGITPQQVEGEAKRLAKSDPYYEDHPDLHEEAALALLEQHELQNWRDR